MKHLASLITVLTLSIALVGAAGDSVGAAPANDFCNAQYKGTGNKAAQLRAACVKGYGLKTKCADLPKGANTTKAEIKSACDTGFSAGSLGAATGKAYKAPDLKGCGVIKTAVIKCDSLGGNPVTSIMLQVVNFLAVGVGLAVLGGIIWGGMLYASSNGDSGKVQQGKMAIVNSIIGLFLFIFMYALINFIVPGGLFR